MSGWISHFAELKQRIFIALGAFVVASVACYFYAPEILGFLTAPLAQQGAQRLIYTELTEAFFTYMKVACVAGFAVASPVIFGQVWMFVAPALYQNEKRAVLPFFIASPTLFVMGAALVYHFVMPLAWKFFLQFQTMGETTPLPIVLEARMSDYLNLALSLIFAFGLCFQLPVLLVLMGRVGIVNATQLRRARRYVIVAAFAVAAILTPPDVISQTILAVPIVLLYELSILFIADAKPNNDTKPVVSAQAEHQGH